MQGRSDEARLAYQSVLEIEAAHPEANHNLALLEFSLGEHGQVLERLMNAIEARPGEPEFWMSLIDVLAAYGETAAIADAIDQAAVAGLAPDVIVVMRERGGLQSGLALEESPPEMAQEAPPDTVDNEVAERVRELLERVARVLDRSRQVHAGALRLEPVREIDAKTHKRIVTLFGRGEIEALAKLASRLTKSHPLHPRGWFVLGVARQKLGDRLEGLELVLKANELRPGDAELLGGLATALSTFGHVAEAEACFRLSVEIFSGHAEVWNNYVLFRVRCRDLDGAAKLAEAAIEAVGESAQVLSALATVRLSQQRSEESAVLLEKVVATEPRQLGAQQNLALSYFKIGRLADAVRVSLRALEHNAEVAACFSNYLFYLSHDETRSAQDVFDEHLRFAERYEKPLLAKQRPHENDRDPARRLRVGFVSGDFWEHAVAKFIEPVFEHLDRNRFELLAFHAGNREDATTARLKGYFDFWASIYHVSDNDAAEIIRALKVDVLIDLSGHTAGNRLLVFARKPAPVQMSWIGYPNTTGLRSMDYHLADGFLAPEGVYDHLFSEHVVRLPSNGTFSHPSFAPPVAPLPALTNGFVTFGSFNRLGKISESSIDLWSRVLQACASSRLLVGAAPSEAACRAVGEAFAARGISPERLMFLPVLPMQDYLEAHNRVDMILDTIPYPGGTTTNLALWMGVPVLTRRGRTRMENGGAGAMARVGMDSFVAPDDDGFVDMAVGWASSPERLNELRLGLRERIRACERRKPEFVTRGLENALRTAWKRWCDGLPAESFSVAGGASDEDL